MMGVERYQKFVSVALTLLMVGATLGTAGAVAAADGSTAVSNEGSFETLEPTTATERIEGTFTRLKNPDGNEYVPVEGAYVQLIAEQDGQREQVAVQQLGEDGSFSFEISDREIYYNYYGANFYVTACAANDAARIVDPSRTDASASSDGAILDNQPDTAPREPVEVTAQDVAAQRATGLPPETHDESSDAVCNYENSGNATGALWAMRTDKVQTYYDASDLQALEGEWRPPADDDYNYSGAFSALEEMYQMYTVLSSINDSTDTWPGQRQVPVNWPADSTQFGLGYEIYIQDDSDHDAYRDTVQHEYGHAVMTDLYKSGRYPDSGRPNGGSYGRISPHNPYKLSNPEFALLEGWAEFIPTAVKQKSTYRSYTNFDVESTNFYEKIDDREDEFVYGADSEGATLNILHDIADDESYEDDSFGDDDSIDGRFEELWRIMKLDNPDNITHIRTLWKERGYGQSEELDEIYRRHGVPPSDVPLVNVTAIKSANKVEPGNEVTIYVELENRPGSDVAGTEQISLSIEDTTLGPGEVTVEPGDTERVAFNWTFDEYGEYQVQSRGESKTINVTNIKEPEIYARDVTAAESTVGVDEEVELTVTYENVGDGEGTVELLPTIDGEPTVGVFPDTQTIEPGETTTETITWTFSEPGTYEMGVVDTVESDTTTVVVGNESNGADVSVTDASLSDSTITTGDAVTASATVENLGDAEGTTTVDLTVDGSVVDTREVTLAPGETTTLTFDRTFAEAGTYDVGVGNVTAGTLTVEQPTSPDISVTDASLSESTITTGSGVAIFATVENAGDAEGTTTVELTVDGTVDDTREVTLAPGETKTLSFNLSFVSAGTYDIAVDGVAAGTLTVEQPASPDISVTGASLSDSTIAPGGTVTASATVENAGDAEGTTTVELTVDGSVVDTREVTLAPGETTTLTFDRTFGDAGTYDVAVGGVAAGTLTVQESSDTCTVIQAVAAFDSDPTTISYSDYSDAYSYYYYGSEVPNTGGETISRTQMAQIGDLYQTGETVEPCQ